MSALIDVEETLALLRRAVAEKGADYVYPGEEKDSLTGGCRYRTEGDEEPSCIAGHVLAYLGVLDLAEELVAADRLAVVRARFTPDAGKRLRDAQRAQDEGTTWGQALAVAEMADKP